LEVAEAPQAYKDFEARKVHKVLFKSAADMQSDRTQRITELCFVSARRVVSV
jgi:hypothetical protein